MAEAIVPTARGSRPLKNIAGQTFGRLTAIRHAGFKENKSTWFCICSCGNECITRLTYLTGGRTKSCGCWNAEQRKVSRRIDGLSQTPEHRSYRSAVNRCTNPRHPAYRHYGGRGIEFRFQSFAEFIAEIGPRPNSEFSLDRINNDGHYELGNIRWATRSQQARNMRRRRKTPPPHEENTEKLS
jgi:hypothetical protein